MAPTSESKERLKLFIFQEKRLFPYQRKNAKEKFSLGYRYWNGVQNVIARWRFHDSRRI